MVTATSKPKQAYLHNQDVTRAIGKKRQQKIARILIFICSTRVSQCDHPIEKIKKGMLSKPCSTEHSLPVTSYR